MDEGKKTRGGSKKPAAGRTSPVEFVIPYPRNKSQYCKDYGLNAYYAGMHWSRRKQNADRMHDTVTAVLARDGISRLPFNRPVKITFWHDDRMDIDNHAVIEKLIVDALKGWLLLGDDRRFYGERVSKFHAGDGVRVRIELIGGRDNDKK